MSLHPSKESPERIFFAPTPYAPPLFIPPQMRDLTGGAESLVAHGHTLGEALRSLEAAHPGLCARIAPAGSLASGLAVSIDGSMTSRGLLAPVKTTSEIHILPAIGGG